MSVKRVKKEERGLRIYAHRGSNRIFPENTLPAFAHSLEAGATHIEMDLHCAQDSHIVVAHDPDGRRTAGVAKKIKECSLSEIQKWDLAKVFLSKNAGQEQYKEGKRREELKKCYIPTLEETLEAFPRAFFSVDIKDHRPEIAKRVVDLIHRRKDEKRVLLTSFSSRILRYVRQIPYKGELLVAPEFVAYLFFCPSFLWPSLRIPGDCFSIPPSWYNLRLDRAFFIHRIHTLGKRVDYWTINDPKKALDLLYRGADGIITDDVELIKEPVLRYARETNRKLEYYR